MNMPMQRLSISGFRGATNPVDIVYDGKPVVMIFGENGTGKSTIVDAIDFVCNEHAGPLAERQSTPVKEFLPALGCRAVDLKVELKWSGNSWKAVLSGAKAKVTGPASRPQARILRRNQILEIVDAQPAQRYLAFSRFVAVPHVEQSEKTLRDAIQSVNLEYNDSTRDYAEALNTLTRLRDEDGATTIQPLVWAKDKSKSSSQDLSGRAQRIAELLSFLQSAKDALTGLSTAKEQEKAAKETVDSFTFQLHAAEEASSDSTNDLLKLLDAAEGFIALHPDDQRCPVCEQNINRSDLLARLAARKSSGAAVAEASRRLDDAIRQLENSRARAKDKQTSFRAAAVRVAKAFNESTISSVLTQNIQWSDFALLLADITPDKLDVADAKARELLPVAESCAEALQSERQLATKELENLRAIKLHFESVLKSRKRATDSRTLLGRLQSVLSVVEAERKTFIEKALGSITERADLLYTKLHPGENLGDITFQLDPNRRGSLNVSSRFETASDVPPQAYYSEAHLDTLGICIFIALAEKDATRDTLLVLDDVLTSADQAHIDRFIQIIHEELKLPVLITTHYRPWRDRYRFAKGPSAQVQLIELLSWSQQRGVRHTKTKLEVDELKEMLTKEPIDRQGIASKAGVLLEATLDYICTLYQCRLPHKPAGNHTLGEYLSGVDSKLRKLLRSVHVVQGTSPGQSSENATDLKPILDAIESAAWIRNMIGAHFNLAGMDILDSQILQFGKMTCELLDATICPGCGELPRKNAGSFYSCGCKARQLHPLTVPGTLAAQAGN